MSDKISFEKEGVIFMTWVTQPGTWTKKEREEHDKSKVANASATFSAAPAAVLTSVKATTEANPADQNVCTATASESVVYEFKRAWTGAGARTSEDFEFTITYTPDWDLKVKAPEGGHATAGGMIKVVIRSGGKDKKTFPTKIDQPISVPPPDHDSSTNPNPGTAVSESSPKFPHTADLDFEVEVEVTSSSEATQKDSSASSVTSVSNCSIA
jgi:hypothetical protein